MSSSVWDLLCYGIVLCIIQGYAKQIERPEMAALVPPQLKGQMGTLFSNMDQIYHFHSK